MKLTRHQLYVLASFATFAQETTMVIKDGSQDKGSGSFEVAWKPKKGHKTHKTARANGYVYHKMDKEGNLTLIPDPKGKKKR